MTAEIAVFDTNMSKDIYTLPVGPNDLCFDKNEFIKESFSVDQFLQDHRKKANLESMRDDLGVYLKVLRSAMIELINKDYADFVNLSSNLIGLDKGITGIQVPLGQLKEEVLQVKLTLDEAMHDVSQRLDDRRHLRGRKHGLQSLARVQSSLSKLSNLLQLKNEQPLEANLVERAASEFNHLQFSISKCSEHLAPTHKQQAEQIRNLLTSSLDKMFLESLLEKNANSMGRCLRIYVTLDKVSDVEELFRKEVVAPELHDIISETALNSDPRGLQGIYSNILAFIDSHMKELLELTTQGVNYTCRIPIVKGYDFLVNSFWPEVEERLEMHLSSIYAPGNPEMFYQRYCETMEFLQKLERCCGTQVRVKNLHAHPLYVAFLHRWNLPVYFQIRFQEIAGSLESVLSDTNCATALDVGSGLQILATATVWDCLMRCWADGVFLKQLGHRFWKLNLQILARYYTWVGESLQEKWTSNSTTEASSSTLVAGSSTDSTSPDKLQFLVCLYTDIEKLAEKLPNVQDQALARMGNLSEQSKQMLQNSLSESKVQLQSQLPVVTQFILGEVSSESMTQLRQVSDIPRLFRRTNREVPTKPCSYVTLVVAPPTSFYEAQKQVVEKELLENWLTLIFSAITQQFYSAVTDVLTSVQKTEESLRRLKKIRDRSSANTPSENRGLGDDDKIRQQLTLDVQSYCQEIEKLGVKRERVDRLEELLTVVEEAQSRSDAIK